MSNGRSRARSQASSAQVGAGALRSGLSPPGPGAMGSKATPKPA